MSFDRKQASVQHVNHLATRADVVNQNAFTHRRMLLEVLHSADKPISFKAAIDVLIQDFGAEDKTKHVRAMLKSKLLRALATLYRYKYINRVSQHPEIKNPLYPQEYLWHITSKGIDRLGL
ncbi:hypothetical protein [Marinobacterium sp. BA1]|uniref:hypothetical protein n=1 Tax=Marinobacterium sp. BA1 TaxID=3138931 RepID=UPI0034E8D132